MKNPNFSKILWFWIAGAQLVIVLVAAFLYFSASRAILLEETGELNRQSLRQSEQNLQLQDANIRTLSRSVFMNPDTIQLLYDLPVGDDLMQSFAILDRFRNTAIVANSLVHSLYFFNFPHNIHYSTKGLALTEDRGLETRIRQLLNTGSLGLPFTRSQDGILLLSYVLLESWDAQGNPERGIIVNVDAGKIIELLRASTSNPDNPDEVLAVLDSTGQILGEKNSQLPDLTGLVKATEIGQTSLHSLKLNGRDCLVSVLPLSFVDWTLVKIRPSEQVYHRLTSLAWWLAGLTLLVMLIAMLASMIIARRLYRPVAELVRAFGGRQDGVMTDEFQFLREAYQQARTEGAATRPENRSTPEIIASYGLRQLLELSPEKHDWSWNRDSGVRIDLDAPLAAAVLWIEEAARGTGISLLLDALAKNLPELPYEVVPYEDQSLVVLANEPAKREGEGPLLPLLRQVHTELKSQGLLLSIVLAEGPSVATELAQTMAAAWSSLKTSRLHQKGEVFLAANIRVSRKHERLVQTMKEVLAVQYQDAGLSVERLASLLNMSALYLARIFKDWEGQTVFEYLVNIRLEQAARLLSQTDSPSIKEVMADIGFENESSFYKGFKNRFGMTPKEFALQAALRSIESQNASSTEDSQE